MRFLLPIIALILMSGCYMNTTLEAEEEGTVCYTLHSLHTQNGSDRTQNGYSCIQNGNNSIEAQVFEHAIPDYAVAAMWAQERQFLGQTVEVVYQFHVHEDQLLDGFVTFYFEDCRLPFDVVPCQASN